METLLFDIWNCWKFAEIHESHLSAHMALFDTKTILLNSLRPSDSYMRR